MILQDDLLFENTINQYWNTDNDNVVWSTQQKPVIDSINNAMEKGTLLIEDSQRGLFVGL